MELQFFGANCVKISTKRVTIVVDDNLADLGAKTVTKSGDIAVYTAAHGESRNDVKLTIDQPGEYEVSDISITGIPARAHIDESGTYNATMYRIVVDDIRVGIVGHVHPDLKDDELEALGTIDILLVPVGGFGYTLDPVGALKVIREIGPKLVIPTHYADSALSYPVPQQDLDAALKALGMEPKETVPKFKVKPGELADNTQLVVLEKS